MFILYPILPVVAYLFLLLKRPRHSVTDMKEESPEGNRVLTFNNFPSIRKSIKSMNAATINYLNDFNKQKAAAKNKEEEEKERRKRMAQKKKVLSDYYAAEYYADFTSAISGGIESPIQFIIQVFK